MSKVLPIVGIVGCVFGALSIAVFVPNSLAMFLPLLVGLVGSIVLVGQRSVLGAVAGLVVLALTVVAALGLVGTVSTEDGGGTDFGIAQTTGQVLAIASCLAIPVAAVALRWERAHPRWLAIAGAACAVVALGIAAADPDGIAQQNQVGTLVAAVLALLAIAAMVPLLRAPADDARDGPPPASAPAPLAMAEAPVGKAPMRPAPPAKPAARSPGRRP